MQRMGKDARLTMTQKVCNPRFVLRRSNDNGKRVSNLLYCILALEDHAAEYVE